MVRLLNKKAITVKDSDWKPWYKEIDWMNVSVTAVGYSMALWVLDYAAFIFVGIHPFPFFQFVGGVFKWLGLI